MKDASLNAGTLTLAVADAPAINEAASVDFGSKDFFRRARERLTAKHGAATVAPPIPCQNV